jgi:hypothetical protein
MGSVSCLRLGQHSGSSNLALLPDDEPCITVQIIHTVRNIHPVETDDDPLTELMDWRNSLFIPMEHIDFEIRIYYPKIM